MPNKPTIWIKTNLNDYPTGSFSSHVDIIHQFGLDNNMGKPNLTYLQTWPIVSGLVLSISILLIIDKERYRDPDKSTPINLLNPDSKETKIGCFR